MVGSVETDICCWQWQVTMLNTLRWTTWRSASVCDPLCCRCCFFSYSRVHKCSVSFSERNFYCSDAGQLCWDRKKSHVCPCAQLLIISVAISHDPMLAVHWAASYCPMDWPFPFALYKVCCSAILRPYHCVSILCMLMTVASGGCLWCHMDPETDKSG